MTEKHGEKTRDSIHKLRQGMLQLDIRKKFPANKVKQWSKLTREQPTVEQPVTSPFLNSF